jgi:hypothetical protein
MGATRVYQYLLLMLSNYCNSLGETRIFECAAGNYAAALRAASYKCPIGWNARSKLSDPLMRSLDLGLRTSEMTRMASFSWTLTALSRCRPSYEILMRLRLMPSSGRWVGELYASRSLWRRLSYETADATPLGRPWVCELGITSREGLLNWAEVNRPHELAVAKRVMQVERATGYRHWYDWQLINWGCK